MAGRRELPLAYRPCAPSPGTVMDAASNGIVGVAQLAEQIEAPEHTGAIGCRFHLHGLVLDQGLHVPVRCQQCAAQRH